MCVYGFGQTIRVCKECRAMIAVAVAADKLLDETSSFFCWFLACIEALSHTRWFSGGVAEWVAVRGPQGA